MAELYKIRSTKNKNKSLDKNPFFNEIKSFLDQYKPAVENTPGQTSDTSGNIETVGLDEKLVQFETEKIEPLRTGFESLNSNTEAIIDALTDEGKINLVQLKAKIQSVKPKELQTMKNNIGTNTNNYNSLKLEIGRVLPLANKTSIDALGNTTKLENTQNMLTSMQKVTKLQLNDTYFNGEMYFMNCGEWGWLEGLITLKETLPRTNISVCPIDFDYPFEGFCVATSAINAFKLENKNIYLLFIYLKALHNLPYAKRTKYTQ